MRSWRHLQGFLGRGSTGEGGEAGEGRVSGENCHRGRQTSGGQGPTRGWACTGQEGGWGPLGTPRAHTSRRSLEDTGREWRLLIKQRGVSVSTLGVCRSACVFCLSQGHFRGQGRGRWILLGCTQPRPPGNHEERRLCLFSKDEGGSWELRAGQPAGQVPGVCPRGCWETLSRAFAGRVRKLSGPNPCRGGPRGCLGGA